MLPPRIIPGQAHIEAATLAVNQCMGPSGSLAVKNESDVALEKRGDVSPPQLDSEHGVSNPGGPSEELVPRIGSSSEDTPGDVDSWEHKADTWVAPRDLTL